MRWCWLFVSLLVVGCSPPVTGRTEEFELASERVGDSFRLFVRLPPDYDVDAARRFPLVVQLDANLPTLEEFSATAGQASELEATGALSSVIVVGVGYRSGPEAQRLRMRDLALPMENEVFLQTWRDVAPNAAAPAFYAFLRDELMPELTARYRLEGAQRTALFGHSMGGLFTVYAASRHQEAPLFSSYVAASPSLFWDDAQVITRFEALPELSSPASLFITHGSLEGPVMAGFVEAFSARTRASARAQLRFEHRFYEVGHLGSTTPSFRDGLLFTFGGAE